MVWIHGGGITMGQGYSALYDPTYFMNRAQKLIIVSMNYRLGLLGFFYDNDYGTGNLYGHSLS